jgi:UDP-glucose 4-epimerase
MRVLVTGGAGFIGSHIVEALRAQGDEVAVLDDLSSGRRENVPSGVKLYQVDLRDRDATRGVLVDFKPNAVSHQAAQASVVVSVREPFVDAQINVLGGLNLLDACTEAKVQHFVFASTGGAIYGEVPEPTLAKETSTPRPVSPYAIHKHTFEQLLGVYATHRGLHTTILRYANVYGPRQDPHGEAGVAAIFFNAVLAGRSVRVNAKQQPGDDGCLRDYVFVKDVAAMNLLALSGGIAEPVLNVGTGVATSTRALAEAIMQVSARRVLVETGPSRPGDVERSVLDPTRTTAHLSKLVPLNEGLVTTHRFFAGESA